ncbi:MAG: hypothetical protein RSG77_09790 [Hafnia sp.]
MHLLIIMEVYDSSYSQSSGRFSAVPSATTGAPVTYDNCFPLEGLGYGGALSAAHVGNASWRILHYFSEGLYLVSGERQNPWLGAFCTMAKDILSVVAELLFCGLVFKRNNPYLYENVL